MSQALLDKILKGEWVDPDNGQPLNLPIKEIVIGKHIVRKLPDRIAALGLGAHIAVVSDKNTYEVIGKQIVEALSDKYQVVDIIIKAPKADESYVKKIREAAASAECYIAVGSGTLNDLCKYASYLDKKPYAVCATAPSMNGYASANAAITVGGHKKSLAAQLPQAIWCDVDILAEAPLRLIRSGVGDSLCRSTCRADWLLSHYVLGTVFKEAPFALLYDDEKLLMESASDIIARDREVIAQLMRLLILSGIGMYICGGSYPASQGEHLIAHTMEMVYGDDLKVTYHGEQIGVTTLTMAQLQERRLDAPPIIKSAAIDKAAILGYFGQKVGQSCLAEYRKKLIARGQLDDINGKIVDNWTEIAANIHKNYVSADKILTFLEKIGAPVTPEGLGWSGERYNQAYLHARYMRDRFTFLDIV